MTVVEWSDRVIRWGYYLLFALVPLLLTPWNYELFEYNKMMAVYALTVVITVTWITRSIYQGEFRIARTPLDIPISLYVGSQLVSSLFSIDPHVSWFGYYSRFNGGMFSVISYILLYYAFVSNVAHWTNWTHLLKVMVASGVVVALYGVAERLGIDKHLWVQDVQNRVFSTLGQPNWLAAYLTALSPLAWGFALKSQNSKLKSQNFLWMGISALFFVVLLFTRSRSGLLGFAIADVVFWLYVFLRSRRFVLPFFILHFTFFLMVFLNGTYIDSVDKWLTLRAWKDRLSNITLKQYKNKETVIIEATPSGTLLEVGGTESGTIRKYVWQGAIDAWRSSPKTMAFGTGTETFAFAFFRFKPQEHNLTSEGDYLYNKAHNEYLNYLATTGFFGLGSYVLFIGVFTVWFLKSQITNLNVQKESKSYRLSLGFSSWDLSVALFAGWLSILVTNFFGFSVVVVQLFLFLFPAMVFVQQYNNKTIQHFIVTLRFAQWMIVFPITAGVGLTTAVVILWRADTLFASGYRANRAEEYTKAVDVLERAVRVNPFEPLYQDELGTAYAGLVTAAIDARDATAAALLVQKSFAASDRALAISPRNVNFWKTRTKIFYSFSSFDPAFNDAAIIALEKAFDLSPRDPKILYNLAILHGRTGANEKAIELLKQTITTKPNYRDAYYALWVFYTEVKKPDFARGVLEDYLARVDPGDQDFQNRLNE